MSHYTVMVLTNDDYSNVDDLLAPYSENVEVPNITTKDEIIKKARENFEKYKSTTYQEYLSDKEKYISRCSHNPAHIKYISEEFPKKFNWTDEDFYKDAIEYEDSENIRLDGSVFSLYSPNSRWDWYVIGGRWADLLELKDGTKADSAKIKDIDFEKMPDFGTFAVLHPTQGWYEKGRMGWWGISSETEDEAEAWDKNFYDNFIKNTDPDWTITIVDCHI